MKKRRYIYLSTRIYVQASAWFYILSVIYASINPLNNIVGLSPSKWHFGEWLILLSMLIILLPYSWNENRLFYILRLCISIITSIMVFYYLYIGFNGLFSLPAMLFALCLPISHIFYKQWHLTSNSS